MKTLLANLKHDARNGKYVMISGGRFTPTEIAAMRCYVTSKMGEEVDIPKESDVYYYFS